MIDSFYCDHCGSGNRDNATFCRYCGKPLLVTSGAKDAVAKGTNQYTLKRRYLILEELGQGGFGSVYKAIDTQFNDRLVAMKEMNRRQLNPEELAEALQTFKQEASMLATLQHPNLPRIYDEFEDQDRSFLVMDYIEGESLERLLMKQAGYRLSLEQALKISLTLCDVLHYLHTRRPPVIFRDLKPANIMLTPTGHLYVVDFGIARLFKPGQKKDTTSLGSLGYAAPEQYGSSQTTTRSDIYSLGSTLHQMITGQDPSQNPFLFAPITTQAPAEHELAALIHSMVERDPEKRPESITLVQQALQHIQEQIKQPAYFQKALPVASALQSSTTKKQVKSPYNTQPNTIHVFQGHKTRVTRVAFSPNGALLASSSFDKTVQIWSLKDAKNQASYPFHTQRVNDVSWHPRGQILASGSDDSSIRIWDALSGNTHEYIETKYPVQRVSWSPDGKLLAYSFPDDCIVIHDIDQKQVLTLLQASGQMVTSISWSPDGLSVAAGYQNGDVRIWDALPRKKNFWEGLLANMFGQETGIILRRHEKQVNGLAWSPDGRYLASVSSDYQILVWELSTETIMASPGLGSGGMLNDVAWSPTGQHLAVAGNDKTVQIWNMRTRAHSLYRGHTGYVLSVSWSPDGSKLASAGVDRTVQVWQII